jgi:hypothetical protein
MSIDELGEELDALDAARLKLVERARAVATMRRLKITADNAADHGLTVHEYEAAKSKADDKHPLQEILRTHRRDRVLQVAKPEVATIRGKVVK